MPDLVILVADKNAQFALKGALSRPQALGIRPIQFEFVVHSGRDGGARTTGPEMLALERRRFTHALLVLDFEGCGSESSDAKSLEAELDGRLSGWWQETAKSIVIEPELDVWVWGTDNALENAIQWPPGTSLREWCRDQGFDFEKNGKPTRPKEAFEAALRIPRLPRSSALYQKIAERISLQKCDDRAFGRLRERLVHWFPPPQRRPISP